MFRFLLWAILAALKPKALLVAENLCLRQQLLVLQRRPARPYLKTVDRFFWVLATRWPGSWRNLLLVVKPKTVLKWHQRGWRLYWSWRSRMRHGPAVVQFPNSFRCSSDEWPWKTDFGAKSEWSGFKLSARTVAKYMRTARHDRGPSLRWRTFLKLHASNIWASDFFCVQTLLFDTLHVFFVIQHINREVLHVAATRHPTAEWLARQILESCAWDRRPLRFMIHDRNSRYGPSFDRRLKRLGIKCLINQGRREFFVRLHFFFPQLRLRRTRTWQVDSRLIEEKYIILVPRDEPRANHFARRWQIPRPSLGLNRRPARRRLARPEERREETDHGRHVAF